MRKRALAVLVIAAAVFGLTVGYVDRASATTFDFTQRGGFLYGSEIPLPNIFNQGIMFYGTQTGLNLPSPGTTYSTIAWGNGSEATPVPILVDPIDPSSPFSGLRVTTTDSGQISDDGVPVIISLLTHQNSPIAPPVLESIVIRTLLRITDPGNGNAVFFEDPGGKSDNNITFTETVNESPCPTNFTASVPCEDFFTFELGPFAAIPITYQNEAYSLGFGLIELTGSFISPPFAFTAEGTTNTAAVVIFLSRVPAPASLLLLGLGLVGVAVAGRIKRSAVK